MKRKQLKTSVSYRLYKKTRRRIHQAFKSCVKPSSTKELNGIHINTYRNWIVYQKSPDLIWLTIANDHAKPISSFDVFKIGEGKESFYLMNTQPLLKEVHQQKGTRFNFLDYKLQFIKAYQFLKLKEVGLKKIQR